VVTTHKALENFAVDDEGDINERPYQDSVAGAPNRKVVRNIATDNDSSPQHSDTPSPNEGPSTLTGDFRTMAGSARAMAQQIAYHFGLPMAKAYPAGLYQRAEQQYGFDLKRIKRLQRPLVGRVLLGDVGKPGELSRLLNEHMQAARTHTADAISRGRKVDASAMIGIADAIGDEGGTVRQALSDPERGPRVIALLRESGAFSESDLASMLETDGGLTEAGKELVERTLLGSAVGDVRALSSASPAIRRKLVRALGPLTRLRRVKEEGFSLDTTLGNALDALAELRDSGLTSVLDLARQSSMLPTPWRKDPRAIAMAHSLHNDGLMRFNVRMRDVATVADANAGGQTGFSFGQPRTVGEAFDDVFGIGRQDAAQDADRQTEPAPEPESAPVEQGAAAEAKPLRMGDIDPATGKMVMQESGDLATLVKQAAAKEGEYLRLLVDVARAAGIPKSQGPRVKSEMSIHRKVAKFKGRRSPATFSDYLGARVGVSRPEQVAEMLKDLESRGNRIIQKEDFIAEPKEETGGYRAVHVQVDIGDGFSAELEIVPGPIFQLQEITHLWYDVTRVVLAPGSEYSDSDKAEAKTLQEAINQTMLDAYEAFQSGKRGPVITPEAALERVPDQFISIIADAKGIKTDGNDATKLREMIAKSVSRTIATIRTIGQRSSTEPVVQRIARHAGIEPLPVVDWKTRRGALAIIKHLGITPTTLKEP
jgi:hypothetical protein